MQQSLQCSVVWQRWQGNVEDHGVGAASQCHWWQLQHRDRERPIEPGFGSNAKHSRKWACPGCGEKYNGSTETPRVRRAPSSVSVGFIE
eukprot:12918128-Prorocentrum_lima.AAC.1